jgi:peptidoglycan hydrolase CwlO-like protein
VPKALGLQALLRPPTPKPPTLPKLVSGLPRVRRLALLAVLLLAGATFALLASGADAGLQGKIDFNNKKAQQLQSGIRADHTRAHAFDSRLADLKERLGALQSSLSQEQSDLTSAQSRLRDSRARLTRLRLRSDQAQVLLARQAVAQYQADDPDIVTVVLDAHGFSDLLERVDAAKTVAKANARVTNLVRMAKAQTTIETARLATLEGRAARQTAAIAAQRDQVARLRLSLADRQIAYLKSSRDKRSRLAAVQARRRSLSGQLAKLRAKQAAAVALAQGDLSSVQIPKDIPGFTPHGGSSGFFQQPGTNYSVGDEPRIVARLDALGKALGLRLLGISGYRTPQHSVEVGGFPNDPHTRGQASDTPGVEGVSEATLNAFGLTRPFGGAAELNHIQLVGSI